MKKILFTGGGTGGHLFPILEIARKLKEFSKEEIEFFYLGPKDKFSQKILLPEGIKVKTILAGKIRRYWDAKAIFQNILDFFKFWIGFFQSLFYLSFLKPNLIFSKGGYGSLPCVLAASILKIPIFLHESDIVAGLSSKILAKFSQKIFVSFEQTKGLPKEKSIFVGNPIRTKFLNLNPKKAFEVFNLEGKKPVLFVIGGSQGSERINNLIFQNLKEILKEFEVIHQLGKENFKKWEEKILKKLEGFNHLKNSYHFFGFLKEEKLALAYKISDLVLSRAGSGTIFEILAFGKPAILIPLPESAQNHQLENAKYFSKVGAFVFLEEKKLNGKILLETLKRLKNNPEKLKRMSEISKKFAKIKAGEEIAKFILKEI